MKKQKESKEALLERAKKFVLEHYNVYSNNRAAAEQSWADIDSIYNSLPITRDGGRGIDRREVYNGTSKVCPPTINRAVNALLNFCDEALWTSTPNFKLQGVGGKEDQQRAEINAKIIELQMSKIGFRGKLRKHIERTIKYGFSISKVPYVLKEKYIVRRKEIERDILDDVIENIGPNDKSQYYKYSVDEVFDDSVELLKEKIPVYDNLDFIPLSPFRVYWNPYLKWEEQVAIIEKTVNISESSLRLMVASDPDAYADIDKIIEQDKIDIEYNMAGSQSEKSKTDYLPHLVQLTGMNDNFNTSKKRYEILECWCNFDIDNDGIDEECVILLLDRKHVIRLEVNPYDFQEKPYVFSKWEDFEEAESLGMGAVQKAENSQRVLNAFTNQMIDDITLTLNCMWVVDSTAKISTEQLRARPGGIIDSMVGATGVTPLRPPNILQEAQSGIAMAKDDIYQATGATVSLQGMPARYDTTATEATQMNNSSQRDVFMKLRHIEDSVIKPFLRFAYTYNLQYMSALDIKKIIGVDAFGAFLNNMGKSVDSPEWNTQEVLIGDYDFIPLGITQIENKIIKGQQIMNLYREVLTRDPQGWNLHYIRKQLVKYVFDNDENVLNDEEDQMLINPLDENILMEQGEKPNAKMQENHQQHIQIHQEAMMPEQYAIIREEHIAQHIKFLQLIAQQQQVALMQQQLMAMQQPQGRQKQAMQGTPDNPTFAPKGITPEQVGQVQGMVEPPVSLGGLQGQING